jgi:hypothetical protein
MFTYDPLDVSTDLAKVRLAIGDTVEEQGPRPGLGEHTNFTDEELQVYLDLAGAWRETVILLYDLLSALWSSEAGSVRMGDFSEDASKKSERYAAAADRMRAQAEHEIDTVIPSFFEQSDSGVEPPHYFGLEQWGADVKDQKLK